MAGGSTFGEELGFAEDDLLDGYEMVEKIVCKNDFVLGITAGGHTRREFDPDSLMLESTGR